MMRVEGTRLRTGLRLLPRELLQGKIGVALAGDKLVVGHKEAVAELAGNAADAVLRVDKRGATIYLPRQLRVQPGKYVVWELKRTEKGVVLTLARI
jgi:plastocyanin